MVKKNWRGLDKENQTGRLDFLEYSVTNKEEWLEG